MNTVIMVEPKADIVVIKRDGTSVAYNPDKIYQAILNTFLDIQGLKGAEVKISPSEARILSATCCDMAKAVTAAVDEKLYARTRIDSRSVMIEDIQDLVEKTLMDKDYYQAARAYIVYREKHSQLRNQKQAEAQPQVIRDSQGQAIDFHAINHIFEDVCRGMQGTNPLELTQSVRNHLFNGCTEKDRDAAMILVARERMEFIPEYNEVAARLMLNQLKREVCKTLALTVPSSDLEIWQSYYAEVLPVYIKFGIADERLDKKLATFDIEKLARELKAERDYQLDILSIQTLYDRYLLHSEGKRYELPQCMFMRIAMGLALNEGDPTGRAIEFYHVLSSFDYMASTPTLFNSGTIRSQLSSCYISSVADDMEGIGKAWLDNAMLQKYAGGIGNDWTYVRGNGARIKGTNGKSQGVIPFLKVANDIAVAVNQGGRRKGAACAYLETWHMDIEEFLDLRKNVGDDRRRTHDMNTANWVPDLFMERVKLDGNWTLFSPHDVPELHDLYGNAFREKYEEYESQAKAGKVKLHKTLRASDLWRKMLSMLFETGHPWITFKDACNLRSPQRHVGVVHSSNLCTEITLNTKPGEEIAVCNLGSVNLVRHLAEDGTIDHGKLRATVQTALRMLDNVIDINFYNVDTARTSNLKHRPVGLGIMGFQDCLQQLKIAYDSSAAVEFADRSQEAVSFYAILASSDLAVERGSYPSYPGSNWSQGILPINTTVALADNRTVPVLVNTDGTLDWALVSAKVKCEGMRNSNCMAIAPTATIANICGVSQSIEPTYQNLYVKSNLSGEFTVVNRYLVRALRDLSMWDKAMVAELKHSDGSVQHIARIPAHIKAVFKTAFEIEPTWLIQAASRRQKWIDQAQSLNLYIDKPSGKKLAEMYMEAWERGLKTTYYLRSRAATQVERSTAHDDRLQSVKAEPKACLIDNPDCESCQ